MRLIHKKLIVFVFVALILFSLIGIGVGGNAYADTSLRGYSGVLYDLQKDETFNPDDYPAIDDDYSLQVIQIAESTAGELFVYVYQPAANVKPLTATQINMSLTDDFAPYDYEDNVDNTGSNMGGENSEFGGENGGGHGGGGGSFHLLERSTDNQPSTYLYDLTLINRNGVFAKYRVTNFCVLPDFVRYYNITSIYRNWDGDIDEPTGNDNIINAVAFPVGKLFTVELVNGKIDYKCHKFDIVIVTDIYSDYLRYGNGFSGIGIYLDNYTDSHYIAFSTDWDISDLYDVDISFCVQNWEDLYASAMDYHLGRNPTSTHAVGKETKKTMFVERSAIGENTPSGWYQSKYFSWNRIQTVENFISTCGIDLSGDVQTNLNGKQWVLRFYETAYTAFEMGLTATVDYTKVTQETILRLHFKSHGRVYNLGAVSDIVSGDNKPGNEGDIGFWAYIWRCIVRLFNGTATLTEQIVAVVAIFLVVFVLPILLTVLSFIFPAFGSVMKTIFKGVWAGIKYLFIGLWYVISSPLRLIIWIVSKIKDGG